MFRLKEKVGALYDFVASNLESPKESFYLYVTPPREDLKDKDLTMMKAGLAPAANVYFGSKFNKESHLSRDCIEATVSANEVLRYMGQNLLISDPYLGTPRSLLEPSRTVIES
jgi:hypothetical protein